MDRSVYFCLTPQSPVHLNLLAERDKMRPVLCNNSPRGRVKRCLKTLHDSAATENKSAAFAK